ncbi:NADH-ubiquinone oxidoreductase chain 5 [Dufourea novaeangliae]|nr:NADH-ubiquinone oxidoreductase chain 5 [Dufourea novaeangliae]
MIYSCDKLILFFIMLAIFTKSAITAPTPVSSLVHSSTLVTAGVYLFIRYNNLFNNSIFLHYVLLLSRFTMFMSGLIANFEINFKKVIALSTLRQLGFIIRILSIGYVELGFFHLIVHAFFKSIIFICAGEFIHINFNNQDIRVFGGIFYMSLLKSLFFIFAIINLCGFPFVSGFYSKDLILESFFSIKFNIVSLILLFFSTVFTIRYRIRLIYWILLFYKIFISLFNFGDDMIIFFRKLFLYFILIFLGNYCLLLLFNGFVYMILGSDKLIFLNLYLLGFYFYYLIFILDLTDIVLIGMFFRRIFYLNFVFKVPKIFFDFIYIYESGFECC